MNKDVKDPNNLDTLSDNQKWIVKCDFSANGYRLPTEAEWEFAARGGNESKGYMFPGSDDFREVGHVFSSKPWKEGMIEVGSYKPNELGLFNMAGNVTEWCWDWFGDYTTDAQTDPRARIRQGKSQKKWQLVWTNLQLSHNIQNSIYPRNIIF
ncbi:MAG: SUMF1/EgtB/PvdO family nonheme iron enzyme [Ignavibacteriales bacterium]|nr:SUMF1/EgtB/PvdO family nonheme iron enzyme [Ignavibacteriales bacterium]